MLCYVIVHLWEVEVEALSTVAHGAAGAGGVDNLADEVVRGRISEAVLWQRRVEASLS